MMDTAPCLGHVDGGELAASTGHKRLDSKSTSINRLFVTYPVVVWLPNSLNNFGGSTETAVTGQSTPEDGVHLLLVGIKPFDVLSSFGLRGVTYGKIPSRGLGLACRLPRLPVVTCDIAQP